MGKKIVEDMAYEEKRRNKDNELAENLARNIQNQCNDATKELIKEALEDGRKKINNKVLNYKEHDIFKAGGEEKLQVAIKKYLFTKKDIKKLRAVTTRRTKTKTVVASSESSSSEDIAENKYPALIRQSTTSNVNATRCEEIKAVIKKHPLRNYLLVCSFTHLQTALVKARNTWPDGRDFKEDDNLFEFVIKTEKPKLPTDPEYEAGNRFVFYFLKGLYEVLKKPCPNRTKPQHNVMARYRNSVVNCELCGGTSFVSGIDIANSKTGDASWSRGMAVISAFDENHDTELGPEELGKLINHLRKKGIFNRQTLSNL